MDIIAQFFNLNTIKKILNFKNILKFTLEILTENNEHQVLTINYL